MTRFSAVFVLGAAGLLFSPAVSSAQFGPYRGYYPSYGYGFSYSGPNVLPPLPMLAPLPALPQLAPLPPLNPFAVPPRYNFQTNSFVQNPYTGATLVTRSFYSGVTPYNYNAPAYYPQTGSYMAGTASPSQYSALQNELLRAQRAMALAGNQAAGNPAGEKGRPMAAVDAGGLPDGFAKALTPADKAKVLSGEALNDVLKEIVKAEPKGGTRPSAFVPVTLLDDVRFGGADAADALNLARRAGNLDFPRAFDEPALKDLRAALDRDFTAVATPLQSGKAPDPAKRLQFEATLKKVELALPEAIKKLPADDATAARTFVGRMTNAFKAMKAGTATGVIDPKWASEGTTVADLVKHMTRHKIQFAAAPAGNEESYTTLYRNLATYLFLLTQPKK